MRTARIRLLPSRSTSDERNTFKWSDAALLVHHSGGTFRYLFEKDYGQFTEQGSSQSRVSGRELQGLPFVRGEVASQNKSRFGLHPRLSQILTLSFNWVHCSMTGCVMMRQVILCYIEHAWWFLILRDDFKEYKALVYLAFVSLVLRLFVSLVPVVWNCSKEISFQKVVWSLKSEAALKALWSETARNEWPAPPDPKNNRSYKHEALKKWVPWCHFGCM